MTVLQSGLESNTATSKDWLEITKDISTSPFIESDDFVTLPLSDQTDFTKADFGKALEKASRKLTFSQKLKVNNGELDIHYDCGCEAECRLKKGFPVWQLTYLCLEHDPTAPSVIEEG